MWFSLCLYRCSCHGGASVCPMSSTLSINSAACSCCVGAGVQDRDAAGQQHRVQLLLLHHLHHDQLGRRRGRALPRLDHPRHLPHQGAPPCHPPLPACLHSCHGIVAGSDNLGMLGERAQCSPQRKQEERKRGRRKHSLLPGQGSGKAIRIFTARGPPPVASPLKPQIPEPTPPLAPLWHPLFPGGPAISPPPFTVSVMIWGSQDQPPGAPCTSRQ